MRLIPWRFSFWFPAVSMMWIYGGGVISIHSEVFTGTFPYVPEYPPHPPVEDHTLQLKMSGDGDMQIIVTTSATLGFNMGTMGFFDGDGTTRLKIFAPGKNVTETFTVYALRGGNYYLIFHPSSLSYGDYRIETVPLLDPIPNDPEPNDSLELARSIKLEETVFGHIGYTYQLQPYDRSDYFEFVLPQDGELDNEFYVPTKALAGYVQSLDGTVRLSDYLLETGPGTIMKFKPWPLKAGRYRLWLGQALTGVSYGGYSFKLILRPAAFRSDMEVNDTPEAAVAISLESMAEGHLGYLYGENGEARNDLVDWWGFNHPQAGNLQIEYQTTTNLPFIVEVIRQDTSQLVFHDSRDNGTAGTLIAKNLPAGSYQLKLWCYRWNWGSYAFRLIAASQKLFWDSWVSLHFTPGEIAAGQLTSPTADPDGDSYSNLMEFGLGLDPRQRDSARLSMLSLSLAEDNQGFFHPALIFQRPRDLFKAVRYFIWYSDSLSSPSWERLPCIEESIALQGNLQTIRFLDPVALDTLPARFYRLGMELKP